MAAWCLMDDHAVNPTPGKRGSSGEDREALLPPRTLMTSGFSRGKSCGATECCPDECSSQQAPIKDRTSKSIANTLSHNTKTTDELAHKTDTTSTKEIDDESKKYKEDKTNQESHKEGNDDLESPKNQLSKVLKQTRTKDQTKNGPDWNKTEKKRRSRNHSNQPSRTE